MKTFYALFIFTLLGVSSLTIKSQEAKITESLVTFKTYPFSDPDPVAKFTKFYPYYRFDGFTNEPREQEWKIITLENEYIKVYVAPQIGGKVLGAIDKQTGQEFIYFNKVVKFRDIAMRGAWTSGGIEFNFGSIGHAPTTASPVNYLLKKNDDGSVSCFVGAPDITSQTEWRVEIRLPANVSYFETNALWYNPSDLKTSLYNWMTASVDVANDLQYYFPGHTEIGHGGEAGPWPLNLDKIDISKYKNNNFGGSKSYHVLGEYADHFLCYFHDKDFGLGHLSVYDEKPGKKIWIWSLSREGGIWEDLLTDPGNVQYTEIQTGLLFNQAAENSTMSPYKHLFFDEGSQHHFSEKWFPVKGIGGMVKANEYGALNVEKENGKLKIGFCAIQEIKSEIVVSEGEKEKMRKPLLLKPGEFIIEFAEIENVENIEIRIGDLLVFNTTETEERKLSKPVTIPEDFDWNSEQGIITKATELEKQRLYKQAVEIFEEALKINKNNIEALTRLAGLNYRSMQYEKAAKYALQALSIDTYNPEANYIFGLNSIKLNKKFDALDGFSVAARSTNYRSVANTQLATIYFKDGDMQKCLKYANNAIDYNRYNINALKLKALVFEKTGQPQLKTDVLNEILTIDPLNSFARFEKNDNFQQVLNYEMPSEICLEQAIYYQNLGLTEKAVEILNATTPTPIINYWLAYLLNDKSYLEKALSATVELVFPFRAETADVLQWALSQQDNWKTNYYHGLIYASVGRTEEAVEYFTKCGFQPDYFGFYLTRFELMKNEKNYDGEADLLKTFELAPENWRVYKTIAEFYRDRQQFEKALGHSEKGNALFPDNYILAYQIAVDLLINEEPKKALKILSNTSILPNEGATYGRTVYRQACVLNAVSNLQKNNLNSALSSINMAREWPENLGVGKPYVTDERIEDYLEMLYWQKRNNTKKAKLLEEKITHYTLNAKKHSSADYLGALILKNNGNFSRAEQLLKETLAENPENSIATWCLSSLRGELQESERLEGEIIRKSGGTLFNPKISDTGFGLVVAISKLR